MCGSNMIPTVVPVHGSCLCKSPMATPLVRLDREYVAEGAVWKALHNLFLTLPAVSVRKGAF